MTDHEHTGTDDERLRTGLQEQLRAIDVGPGDLAGVTARGRRRRTAERVAWVAAVVVVAGGGVAAAAGQFGGPFQPEVLQTPGDASEAATPAEVSPSPSEQAAAPTPDATPTADATPTPGAGPTTPSPTADATTDPAPPTTAPTTSDDVVVPEDPEPDAPAGPTNQAEDGLRFDLGTIAEVFTADGRTWIAFDRYQVDGTGAQGTDLDEEPDYALGTDLAPFISENDRLRTYRLAADVEVLGFPDVDAACAQVWGWDQSSDDEVEGLPYEAVGTAFLPTLVDRFFVTLTFDDQGEVVRVRDQRGC